MQVSNGRPQRSEGSAYCVAVRVPARYGEGLVEQAVADLAGEVVAEAVKLGLEGLELLWRALVQTVVGCGLWAEPRTSSALLGWGASSFFISIFCLRLSLLAARVGRSVSASFEAERLAVGVPPRPAREVEDMAADCEGVAVCEGVVADVMDDDEFLGRAVGGVGDARLSMAAGDGSLFSRTWAAGRC